MNESARSKPFVSVIKIRNFKSLKECDISLGRVNVFIGPNGAGKSNFLEAVGVLGAALGGKVDDESLFRRGVRPGVPALYKSSFKGGRLPSGIELGASLGVARTLISLRNPVRPGSTAWTYFSEGLYEGELPVAGRSQRSKAPINPESGRIALAMADVAPETESSILVDALNRYAIYTPTTAILQGIVQEPVRPPVGLSGGRLAEAFQELLLLTRREERGDYFKFIPWAQKIGVRSAGEVPISPSIPTPQQVLQFEDKYMAEGRNRLSAYDASEGALFVLFSLVAALHPHMPPMFAIDNFDHGIHPVLGKALLDQVSQWILSKGDRQILLTLQNPAMLDGLPLDNPDVRLFVVNRTTEGLTNIHPLMVTPQLLEMAKAGWTLSRMWVAGHLGGVPDV